MADTPFSQTHQLEKRIERLEAETKELYLRLYQRDKAFDRIRQAYIGIRPEERDR